MPLDAETMKLQVHVPLGNILRYLLIRTGLVDGIALHCIVNRYDLYYNSFSLKFSNFSMIAASLPTNGI
jgi:hypothetical protein